MKRWMFAGLALAVLSLGAWTYRATGLAPDRGRDLAEPGPGLDRPVLQLEGFASGNQEGAQIAPSGSGEPL